MSSTYSDLKFELMATGEKLAVWGDITNTNLGTAVQEALTGSADVTFASADVTLTLTNTNTTQTARNLRLNLVGTSGGAHNLIVPAIEKIYVINNTCADAITVKNSTGTGIAVPAGKTMLVYNDSTNVVDAVTALSSLSVTNHVTLEGVTSTGATGTGKLVFDTSPNFTGPVGIGMTPTNILDITQTQNGTSKIQLLNGSAGTAAVSGLWLSNGTDTFRVEMFGTGNTVASRLAGLTASGQMQAAFGASSASFLNFTNNGTEVGRFAVDNSLVIGTTASGGWNANAKVEAKQTATGYALSAYNSNGGGGGGGALLVRVDNTPVSFASFIYAGSGVGSITTNGTNTAYNTSSDARLKTEIMDAVPEDAERIIRALRVRSYRWVANGQVDAFGFIAQEEYDVAPWAVTPGDNNPDIVEKQWARDDAKLVPALLLTVQKLLDRVAALEAK